MKIIKLATAGLAVGCAFSLGALAKPIAFARGYTVMTEYGAGSMLEAQAFYAPSYRYSLGISALRLQNSAATRDQTVLRANYLLRRWNLPTAQGNVFVYGGIGSAQTHAKTSGQLATQPRGFASNLGVQSDYETRWLFASARVDWNHSPKQSFRIDTVQFGLAPYAHGYRDWATFFLLQARQYQGGFPVESFANANRPEANRPKLQPIQPGIETAALVRLFRGNFWLEAGVTNQGKPQAMLMMNF
jgi:hypothetical protein